MPSYACATFGGGHRDTSADGECLLEAAGASTNDMPRLQDLSDVYTAMPPLRSTALADAANSMAAGIFTNVQHDGNAAGHSQRADSSPTCPEQSEESMLYQSSRARDALSMDEVQSELFKEARSLSHNVSRLNALAQSVKSIQDENHLLIMKYEQNIQDLRKQMEDMYRIHNDSV